MKKVKNKERDQAIELNKGYNWEVIPKKYKNKVAYPIVKEIEIDHNDPVLSFKEWDGKYWQLKKYKDV